MYVMHAPVSTIADFKKQTKINKGFALTISVKNVYQKKHAKIRNIN